MNARGTVNVAAAARAAGVRRFVHVSSNSPFGTNPHNDDVFRNDEPYHPYLGYGRSKMLAELRLLEEVERGLDAVIVRPPWFYGPHQPARQTTFFTMVRTGRFPVLGDGRQRRSMVYVDNLVDGVLAAELTVTPPGRGWWIADARPYDDQRDRRHGEAALADEGFEVKPNRQLRLPTLVGRVAERADRVVQRAGRYVAAAARARRDGQDDRLRHLGRRRTSSATSPQVDSQTACGAASGGASTKASAL